MHVVCVCSGVYAHVYPIRSWEKKSEGSKDNEISARLYEQRMVKMGAKKPLDIYSWNYSLALILNAKQYDLILMVFLTAAWPSY
jgi:hypothetical protein